MQALKRSIGPASGCLVQASGQINYARCLSGRLLFEGGRLRENGRAIGGSRHQSSGLPVSSKAKPIARSNAPEREFSDSSRGVENLLEHKDQFHLRHIGPRDADIEQMLALLGYSTLDELIEATVPEDIRLEGPLEVPEPMSERQLIEELQAMGSRNAAAQWRSYIGLGYYDCITPAAITRNLFENPGWTTAYTAYQAEIAQGRLESLMNYQTMVTELTGMEVANASLLDEATAAAEALQVCERQDKKKRSRWLVSSRVFPQTRAVVATRAEALGIRVDYFDELEATGPSVELSLYSGLLVQNPNSQGNVIDLSGIIEAAHRASCLTVVASDLLACTLIKPPGEMGADLCVGSSQRFGVALNFGGPHAGFLSCTKTLVRAIPGRIVGLTRDSNGRPAYRFALQTREQHIRRDKATSNICTAQALLANMSAMYALYHGPEGLAAIAGAVHQRTSLLARLIADQSLGSSTILNENCFFDTLTIRPSDTRELECIKQRALEAKINLRLDSGGETVGVSLDEATRLADVFKLAALFRSESVQCPDRREEGGRGNGEKCEGRCPPFGIPLESELAPLRRTSAFMQHPIFSSCRSEAQLVRYMKHLENKDISLVHSMIPLGSCTMKLNATSEMLASSWPQFAHCHPFQPRDQVRGYMQLIEQLEDYLCKITGYHRISFQPNSGAQGEYAGLRCIRSYLASIGQSSRDVCLIPVSAHGTNPASAQMAGFKIKPVRVNSSDGSIDISDLKSKIEQQRDQLACLMVTYPSTFGIFDAEIRNICHLVHEAGGQVYLDGANMNAQVGICRPGDYGSDVSHLNLHKTFCIPHGGGGPGAGPIGVKSHLAPFLPKHPLVDNEHGDLGFGTVSSSHWGSAAILPISWAYIRLMSAGLTKASQVAILNANYMMRRLDSHYKILFKGPSGTVAHEFIIDCSEFKKTANIEAIDIAKRLQDFGFHAPTVSWPVTNSLMLEPTESEDKQQLDQYCDALISIRQEIKEIEQGSSDSVVNPLKMAPHTQEVICNNKWTRPYSREQAAFPAKHQRDQWNKVWPTVGRVDDIFGDTNLFCTCSPIESNSD